MDILARERRLLDAEVLRREKAELDSLDADLRALELVRDLVVRAALTAAGCRQHKRGEWRRQRERANINCLERSEQP
jgi:hypothetical protein